MSAEVVKVGRPALVSGSAVAAIVPTTIEEVFRMARAITMAGWAPKSYLMDARNPTGGFDESKVVVGIMHGMELGLTPIASLQSIAVINGTPSIWGDGALAVVQASGLLEDFREEPIADEHGAVTGYVCTAKRRGIATPITQTFTIDDARNAGLLGKQGPWQQYRSRMLQMRARAWTLRAGFADVLRGLSIAEEASDIPAASKSAVRAESGKRPQVRSAVASLDVFSGVTGKPDPAPALVIEPSSGAEEAATLDGDYSDPEGSA